MNAPHFTEAVVHKKLSTVDTAKGPGSDQLHLFMLQVLADLSAETISAQPNKSIQSGDVPQDWRKTTIRPFS